MKIRLIYILMASLGWMLDARSQITVDSIDMPSIGDTIIMGLDTMPAITSVGGAGMQTWDFTSLQIHDFDSSLYVDPASTTNGSGFPGSNLAISGPTVSYQTLNGSALTTDGYAGADPFGQGLDGLVPFSPVQTLLELPATLGSSFMDTSNFDVTIETASLGLPIQGLDSIRLVHSSYITSDIDAYGTLNLPGGDYNTIRQLYTEEFTDSIFAYCSEALGCNVFISVLPFGWSFVPSILTDLVVGVGNPVIDTTYTYRWFTNGEDLPVAWVETDMPGGNVLNAGFQLGYKPMGILSGSNDASCATACDGDATVSVLNGTPPFTYVWDDPMGQATATATGLCAGSYSVYIIDALNDTSASVSATIGEPAPLTVTVSATPDSGNADGVATATVAGGAGTYTYEWSTTPPQVMASASNLAAGSYTVTVTDANGCTAIETVLVDTYVGLENISDGKKVMLYPNPSSESFNIHTAFGFSGKVELYDILGNKIHSGGIQPGLNRINIQSFPRGIYLIKVLDSMGELVQCEKLVFN